VVALQIHGVSESTRRTLSAEARARDESLQEYLLDLLDREAHDIDNRRLLAEWPVNPANHAHSVAFVGVASPESEVREAQLAH